MKEEDLDEIRECIEEAIENALEDKLEGLADEIRDLVEEVSYDSVSEAFEEGIEQYLADHEFKLSDGTIIQSRPMTKVMNPDKTKVLICYGGLRVDGCSLVVQTAISRWEKQNGKHPTQKPLSVVSRAVLASTRPGETVVDPFCGSSTTGIAAAIFGREYIGIDTEPEYLELSKRRYEELMKNGNEYYIKKIEGLIDGIDYLKPESKCM